MKIRIGLCGAGGTGKSTIAKEVSKRYNIPLIQSPSRAIFEKHGARTEDDQNRMTPEQRLALQLDIFAAISDLTGKHSHGIFERMLVDNYFYLLLRCFDVASPATVLTTEEEMARSLSTYDLILYFPLYNWSPPSDGMRTQNLAMRTMASSCILGALTKHGAPFYSVPDMDVEQRMTWLEHILKRRNLI